MPISTTRLLCTTQDVARIFDVTMGRVRQMALAGELWHDHIGAHCLVFDLEEVHCLAAARAKARAEGRVRGPKPGGFKKERPISKKRLKASQENTSDK